MTKDEILAMSVGSGMDILIAEKVMEWKERVDFDYVDGVIAHYVSGTMDVVKFEPSTDIAAAWMVLQKFNSHKISLLPVDDSRVVDGKIHQCFIDKNANCAYGLTVTEAICKAALLALE